MSTVVDSEAVSPDGQPTSKETLAGYVAEFSGPEALMQAARRTRDAGFKEFDCYVPYPIHGLDDAMGVKPTRLPFIVLGCAFVGLCTAILLQWFTNAYDYKFIISGKPFFSIPSSMPVTFELTVLFSAFGALLGMLALNELPKFYNRLFLMDPFQKVTTNGFFLGIEAKDPKFTPADTKAFLENVGAKQIVDCMEPHADESLPQILIPAAVLLLVVGLIPLVIVARMRAMPSNLPRIELVQDMDFQPKLKTQKLSEMFVDSRGMRPILPGTLARGDLQEDAAFFEGLQQDQADDVDRAMLLPNAKNPDGTTVNLANMPWVEEIPVDVDDALMARGQERYNIYCAVCHGRTGKGMASSPCEPWNCSVAARAWAPGSTRSPCTTRQSLISRLGSCTTQLPTAFARCRATHRRSHRKIAGPSCFTCVLCSEQAAAKSKTFLNRNVRNWLPKRVSTN